MAAQQTANAFQKIIDWCLFPSPFGQLTEQAHALYITDLPTLASAGCQSECGDTPSANAIAIQASGAPLPPQLPVQSQKEVRDWQLLLSPCTPVSPRRSSRKGRRALFDLENGRQISRDGGAYFRAKARLRLDQFPKGLSASAAQADQLAPSLQLLQGRPSRCRRCAARRSQLRQLSTPQPATPSRNPNQPSASTSNSWWCSGPTGCAVCRRTPQDGDTRA